MSTYTYTKSDTGFHTTSYTENLLSPLESTEICISANEFTNFIDTAPFTLAKFQPKTLIACIDSNIVTIFLMILNLGDTNETGKTYFM